MAARPPPSSSRMITAPRTGAYQSVSWTSWPPGADRNPGRCPFSYSSGVRTSNR